MRHELALLRVGLRAIAGVAAVCVGLGIVLDGAAGVASAALGVGLVVANHVVAVASTGWARIIRPAVVAVGYAVFVVRMFAVFAAFAVLTTVGWIHDGMLAASFCAALVAALAAEVWSYARGSYVPSWRRG